MSVSTANRLPSLIRPIAMPATCAFVGTPASISARLAPHTDAIDELPFDSVISDTTRSEYANSSAEGSTASNERFASRPWPISRRFGDPLVARGTERGDDERLRLAAREERGSVRSRQHAAADRDRSHRARIATIDARLACEDLLADDLRFEVEQHIAGMTASIGRRVGVQAFGVNLRCDLAN